MNTPKDHAPQELGGLSIGDAAGMPNTIRGVGNLHVKVKKEGRRIGRTFPSEIENRQARVLIETEIGVTY